MIEAVLLAGAVSGAILLTDDTGKDRSAVTHIALATYKYTELDKQIEPAIKNIEKRYIPEAIRDLGISGYFMYRIAVEQKIEYTWSF